jgi:hypothetical protein
MNEPGELSYTPFPPPPLKKKEIKGVWRVMVRLLAVWFARVSAVMMLLIVPVRVQDSRCMSLGLVSWDILILAGVRLLVVLLVVVWPVVSNMPILDDFFRRVHVLHVTCIIYTGCPKCKWTNFSL